MPISEPCNLYAKSFCIEYLKKKRDAQLLVSLGAHLCPRHDGNGCPELALYASWFRLLLFAPIATEKKINKKTEQKQKRKRRRKERKESQRRRGRKRRRRRERKRKRIERKRE